ncbi:MAG TPA: hypothetical protein VF483_12595, partial [Gemmatimonadaceae bacterium]
MQARQKQLIESYQRVQAFLEANPAPAPASYGGPLEMLESVVSDLNEHTSDQVLGGRLSKSEQRRQQALCVKLREHHLRPLVAVAKAEMTDLPGIERLLTMPPATLGVTKLVAEGVAFAKAAVEYKDTFVKNGRPADFLDQLNSAISDLVQSTKGRAQNVGRQVGAKAGIAQQAKRGRDAVNMLDSIVKVVFEGNDPVLRA